MIEIFLALLAGLLIGSFLNVCIYRLPLDLSVAKPSRSFCPHCEKTIAWYDNIPVVSYIALSARCRHCRERIPLRYPIVELATGLAFALCVAFLGPTPLALKFAIFSAILITLISTDLEEMILPDEFTLGGLGVAVIIAMFVEPGYARAAQIPATPPMWTWAAGALGAAAISGGVIWLVAFLYEKIRHREGLGMGDVKMIAMIAAFIGLRGALLTWVLASLFGAIIGSILAWSQRRKAATFEVPFGTFLGFAALILAAFGAHIERLWAGMSP
jgi:leader peptidase (prepilin peptidase)/N-methyltransferase